MSYAITDTLPDAEDLAKEWLLSLSSITTVVGRDSSNSYRVYLGMPKGSPIPCITLGRSGGAPENGEVPVDVARITFNCWGSNRPQAKAIAKALVAAALSLKGSYWTGQSGARIHGARVLLQMFLPDPGDSTTPRYVVDIALTTTSA